MKQVVRPAIGAVLVALAIFHYVVPRVDAISLALVVLALALFLAPWLESREIPGFLKITYRQVSEAGAKIAIGRVEAETRTTASEYARRDARSRFILTASDPNLSLVALRIEIERRLRELASVLDVDGLPLSKLLREAVDRGALANEVASGLSDLISLGNKAAHGASVEPAAADWARSVGPLILEQLDRIIESHPSHQQQP